MNALLQVEELATTLQQDSIERQVHSRTSGTIRGLRIEVNDQSVVMTGRAPTYYTKQLATHAVLDAASHAVQLTNNIEVY